MSTALALHDLGESDGGGENLVVAKQFVVLAIDDAVARAVFF
jgi:hypothetical protein